MNDPQVLIGIASAIASWCAVGVMLADHRGKRTPPPPAVLAGPDVPRKATRPRRRSYRSRTLRPAPRLVQGAQAR